MSAEVGREAATVAERVRVGTETVCGRACDGEEEAEVEADEAACAVTWVRLVEGGAAVALIVDDDAEERACRDSLRRGSLLRVEAARVGCASRLSAALAPAVEGVLPM